jgi:hypothetical protein
MLAHSLQPALEAQLAHRRALHEQDLAGGRGRVELPGALARKYPRAPWEWRWQWVFPQQRRWRNAETGEEGCHTTSTAAKDVRSPIDDLVAERQSAHDALPGSC